MMGRNHVVANVASLVIVTDAAATVSYISTWRGEAVSEGGLTASQELVSHGIDGILGALPLPSVLMWALFVLLYLFGTLLPDIDSKSSLLGRHLHLPFEHRTWTHAIWFPIVFAIGAFAFPPMWGMVLGYVLHLFWDALSVGGVCWFYPISQYRSFGNGGKVKKNHKLKLYRVGATSEIVTVAVICVLAVVLTFLCSRVGMYGPGGLTPSMLHLDFGSVIGDGVA